MARSSTERPYNASTNPIGYYLARAFEYPWLYPGYINEEGQFEAAPFLKTFNMTISDGLIQADNFDFSCLQTQTHPWKVSMQRIKLNNGSSADCLFEGSTFRFVKYEDHRLDNIGIKSSNFFGVGISGSSMSGSISDSEIAHSSFHFTELSNHMVIEGSVLGQGVKFSNITSSHDWTFSVCNTRFSDLNLYGMQTYRIEFPASTGRKLLIQQSNPQILDLLRSTRNYGYPHPGCSRSIGTPVLDSLHIESSTIPFINTEADIAEVKLYDVNSAKRVCLEFENTPDLVSFEKFSADANYNRNRLIATKGLNRFKINNSNIKSLHIESVSQPNMFLLNNSRVSGDGSYIGSFKLEVTNLNDTNTMKGGIYNSHLLGPTSDIMFHGVHLSDRFFIYRSIIASSTLSNGGITFDKSHCNFTALQQVYLNNLFTSGSLWSPNVEGNIIFGGYPPYFSATQGPCKGGQVNPEFCLEEDNYQVESPYPGRIYCPNENSGSFGAVPFCPNDTNSAPRPPSSSNAVASAFLMGAVPLFLLLLLVMLIFLYKKYSQGKEQQQTNNAQSKSEYTTIPDPSSPQNQVKVLPHIETSLWQQISNFFATRCHNHSVDLEAQVAPASSAQQSTLSGSSFFSPSAHATDLETQCSSNFQPLSSSSQTAREYNELIMSTATHFHSNPLYQGLNPASQDLSKVEVQARLSTPHLLSLGNG